MPSHTVLSQVTQERRPCSLRHLDSTQDHIKVAFRQVMTLCYYPVIVELVCKRSSENLTLDLSLFYC